MAKPVGGSDLQILAYLQAVHVYRTAFYFGVCEMKETVKEALHRYEKELKSGKISPGNRGYLWEEAKAIFELGPLEYMKRMEIWLAKEKKRNEKQEKEYPLWGLAMSMWRSDNPVHRAFIKFMMANPNRMPMDDALEESNIFLKREIEESAKQHPAITQPLPPIYADRLEEVKKLSQKKTIRQIAFDLAISASTVKRDRKLLKIGRQNKVQK